MIRNEPKNKGAGSVRGAFLFLLLAAFAVLSLIVVLVGAKVYACINTQNSSNYLTRTTLSYIAGKVRAAERTDAIEVLDSVSCPALLLYSEYGETRYVTYIYVFEGKLREYFMRADADFRPQYGEEIAEAIGFSASIERGLLSVCLMLPDGTDADLTLYLPCEEVVE